MTKKVIIPSLIILIIINTIFWLYIDIRALRLISINKDFNTMLAFVPMIREEERRVEVAIKGLDNYVGGTKKITEGFVGDIIIAFTNTFPHCPLLILTTIDIILIAISFMLYKKK